MSTVNIMADVQTGQAVALPERQLSELTEPKFTATQIENDCPSRLTQIGREIAERLKKADKHANAAADQVLAVDLLLAEAKGLCDGAGFDKFRERFCPQLGKSQAYARLAIATGKKTLPEHRTAERERKQKSRATQRASSFPGPSRNLLPEPQPELHAETGVVEHHTSGNVQAPASTIPGQSRNLPPEAEAQPEPQGVPTDTGVVKHPSTAVERTPGPSKPWGERASAEGLLVFTAHTTGLYKATMKRPAEHFSATSISVEILEHLGNLFTGLAKLMRAKAGPITVLPANGAASVEQPAVKPQYTPPPEASFDKAS